MEVRLKIPNYIITHRIGEGWFGSVYKAVEIKKGEGKYGATIAVKIPQRKKEKFERLEKEARIALTLDHKNIVKVYDFLKTDGHVAMVMEYLGEKDLNKIIHDPYYYDYETLLYFCREVAQGLSYIHTQGLIHRDVKPSNILVSENLKKVKITDFGSLHPVKQWWQKEINGQRKGYASAGQKKGEELDVSSDIYSFGKVMFTLFMKKLRRKEPSIEVPTGMYHIVSSGKEEIPEKIEKVIMKAIGEENEKGYTSMGELIEELNKC